MRRWHGGKWNGIKCWQFFFFFSSSPYSNSSSQGNLARTWGNRGCHCGDMYRLHPCGLCSQHTTAFPFPAAGGHVQPPASSHLPSWRPPPWRESRTAERERVCNTARDTFHTLRVQGRARGDLAKEVRDVWTENKDTFYFTTPRTVHAGGERWDSAPWMNPHLGERFFDEGNFFSSTFF